jgi:transposase-like protein
MLRAGRSPRELAEALGVSEQTLRNWRRQNERDRGERDDGLTSDDREELRRLRRDNAGSGKSEICGKRLLDLANALTCRLGQLRYSRLRAGRQSRFPTVGEGNRQRGVPPMGGGRFVTVLRRSAVRSARRAVALVVTTALLIVLPVAPASAATYVGLGDSAASGPLIPYQIPAPLGCWRSDHNFAHVLARWRAISLKDVSCSGARTDHMSSAQNVYLGPNPPQLDALSSDTHFVTLQIGGNDIGFGEIVDACTTASPFGHPCRDRYAPAWPDGPDVLADRIAATAPKVAAVLDKIHALSPDARVLVVGYAAILPHTGSGCWPKVALAWQDVPYLRATHEALNAMLQDQASTHNATYVDTYNASRGFDACRSVDVRWVEPSVPVNPAAPLHPNARGMRGVAATISAAM